MDAQVVCIDQTKKSAHVKLRATWFPHDIQPSVELAGQRDRTHLWGAITENGDRFFSRLEEYVTADHAEHFIIILLKGFEYDLIIVLNGTPYVQASVITDLAARDSITSSQYQRTFSNSIRSKSAETTPTALSNRFIAPLTELTAAIDTALDQLSGSKTRNYF